MPRHRKQQARGFVRGPRVADKMTREHYAFVAAGAAAERAGDLGLALEYHQGVPMFSRSRHRALLTQLCHLGGNMPAWVWARLAAYLTCRVDDPDSDTGVIARLARAIVSERFHAQEMERLYVEGGDPVQLMATVLGEDWVFHQICCFELRGLEAFIEEHATGRLAENAELASAWCDSEMGVYQLQPARPGEFKVLELRTNRSLDLLDLGGAEHAADGGWLLGRVVPTGTRPALMFDTRPIPLDELTAHAVAGSDSPSGWVSALLDAIEGGRLSPDVLMSEDRELVTDISGLLLLDAGTPPASLAATRDSLRHGRDEISRAAFRILRSAAEGDWEESRASFVGAAALQPRGFSEAQRLLTRDEQTWERWASLVPQPARAKLLELGTQQGSASA